MKPNTTLNCFLVRRIRILPKVIYCSKTVNTTNDTISPEAHKVNQTKVVYEYYVEHCDALLLSALAAESIVVNDLR
jgi:hypothetical protein